MTMIYSYQIASFVHFCKWMFFPIVTFAIIEEMASAYFSIHSTVIHN